MSLLSTSNAPRLLAAALLAVTLAVGAARGAETPTSVEAKLAATKEKAKKASPAELRKLYEEVRKKRDDMISDFDALSKQMKDATEEKKKEIREKLEAQKKNFEEVTTALLKQIREEQRKGRQTVVPGKQ